MLALQDKGTNQEYAGTQEKIVVVASVNLSVAAVDYLLEEELNIVVESNGYQIVIVPFYQRSTSKEVANSRQDNKGVDSKNFECLLDVNYQLPRIILDDLLFSK